MKLRKYQQEAKTAILEQWHQGNKRTLLTLPTGCGKTIVFAAVINELVKAGRRPLVLAHRDELLKQAADKIYKAYGLECAFEKAEQTCIGTWAPVAVGSVQSVSRRLERFLSDYFTDIIVDEAHHCLSDSYKKIFEHFKDCNVLGVTATPDRADKKQLSAFFDSAAYDYTMRQAIKDGFLSPIKAQLIPIDIDISGVSINGGDYAVNEVDDALMPYLDKIADEMQTYCRGRKTVVFLPLIETSKRMCAILRDKGFKATEINGKSKDREQVLQDFDSGEYDVLCNSMLLTEGWDCPSVDCIIVLRPTRSRALYQQMIGRGTRLCEGKKELLVLDFLWLTERHDLCRPSSLVAKSAEIAEQMTKQLETTEEAIDLLEIEQTASEEVVKQRESALAKELAEMRQRKRKLVDPLQYMLSIYEEDLVDYEPIYTWEMAPPSKKQLERLERRGINPDSVQNAGMATKIIDRLVARQQEGFSTPKQIRCLERFGFVRVGEWSFEDASYMIGQLAADAWSIPKWVGNAWEYKPSKKKEGEMNWNETI